MKFVIPNIQTILAYKVIISIFIFQILLKM